jgi:hypothetical protein
LYSAFNVTEGNIPDVAIDRLFQVPTESFEEIIDIIKVKMRRNLIIDVEVVSDMSSGDSNLPGGGRPPTVHVAAAHGVIGQDANNEDANDRALNLHGGGRLPAGHVAAAHGSNGQDATDAPNLPEGGPPPAGHVAAAHESNGQDADNHNADDQAGLQRIPPFDWGVHRQLAQDANAAGSQGSDETGVGLRLSDSTARGSNPQ